MTPIQSEALAEWLYRYFGFDQMTEGWDGDAYVILVGPDLQEGHGFFGSTPAEALDAASAARGRP